MPRVLSRKKVTAQHSPSWSFTLHGRSCISDSDTSSDEESKTEEKSLPISEDARLLRELDLSSRPDDAVFKSNPWTIAKVNAASRAPATKSSVTNKDKVNNPPKRQPSGRIVDALRVQASKPSSKREAASKPPQRKQQPPPRRSRHPARPLSKSTNSGAFQSNTNITAERDGPTALSASNGPLQRLTYATPVFQDHLKAISHKNVSSHEGLTPHISSVGAFHEDACTSFDAPEASNRAEMSDSSVQLEPPSSEDVGFSGGRIFCGR